MFLPYVGVTAFMSRYEVERVLTPEVRKALHAKRRQLMVGVLVSRKSMAGEPLADKWRWQYPKPADVASIFQCDRDALNLVHYNSKTPAFGDELLRVDEIAGPYCDGFQLNMAWPDTYEIVKWTMSRHRAGRDHRLVLQIGRQALEDCGGKMSEIRHRLQPYGPVGVTDVLFDLSGGEGIPMSVHAAHDALTELEKMHGPHINFGVAGGLGPGALHPLPSIFQRVPHASIDAQGKLRTVPIAENAAGGDDLDTTKARAYVLEALALCP